MLENIPKNYFLITLIFYAKAELSGTVIITLVSNTSVPLERFVIGIDR